MSIGEEGLSIPKKSDLEKLLETAERLRESLKQIPTIGKKFSYIEASTTIQELLIEIPQLGQIVEGGIRRKYLLFLFLYLDRSRDLITQIIRLGDAPRRIASLVDRLEKTEAFYESIGGMLGYYCAIIQLLLAPDTIQEAYFEPPPALDCTTTSPFLWKACYEGASRLSDAAEIYAVGGAGDRLKLHDAMTGEPLPVAALRFGGRTLIEWLFRDLLSREYWHYRLFGKQVRVPVLIMTSEEKNNDREIRLLMERHRWFHRGKKSVFIVAQPLVPAVTTSGHFAFNESFELVSKPGGHGVVWKLFQDAGVFNVLVKRGISYLLVRQVNNPISGLDHVLMSFFGMGMNLKKTFGFVGCPRRPGFAEGMLALCRKPPNPVCIANIEYTEFDALQKQLSDKLKENCPANTNILFASIQEIQKALRKDPIPGVMVNAKTEHEVVEGGVCVRRKIARLESMMQAISLNMSSSIGLDCHDLSAFVGLYDREKSLSVTKRAFEQGKNFHETPEACLYDWLEACRHLFSEMCHFKMPPSQSFEDFLRRGPNFVGFFHPALGPLWSVIGQKVKNGTISSGSELELEIAEISMEGLQLHGSLRILSLQPVGSYKESGHLVMNRHVGRAYIRNFAVRNKGMQNSSLKDHLNRMVNRAETCTIVLEGRSEIIIEDVTIDGNFELTVPDKMQARIVATQGGHFEVIMSPYKVPSFEYRITWDPAEAPKLQLDSGRTCGKNREGKRQSS